MTRSLSPTPIEDKLIYGAGGATYTGAQIAHALQASASLVAAYARANENNGGGGHIDWEDVDGAHEEALHAMAGRIDAFNASARQQNQHGD